MIIFLKAHPATQAMSASAKPADLNEGEIRRNPGEPDASQAEASTYNKPRVEWQGLTIAIENPAGSVRRGRNRHGVTWEVRMRFDYGEILGTLGVDGDPVDVILGPNLDAPTVYVVHQRKVNDWENYDEDKCCVGFDSEEDAAHAFLSNYNDPRFLGPITAMPVDEFVAKVRATRDAPAMIKAASPLVLFMKARVGAYLRGGKMVNLAGYQGRAAKPRSNDGQLSLFAPPSVVMGPNRYKDKHPVRDTRDLFGEPQHTEPTHELIEEHEHLIDVLNSPSHEDDKVEANKQAGELEEYKKEAEAHAAKPEKKPTKAKKDDVSIESGEIRNSAVAKIGGRVVGHATAWKDSNGDFVIMESAVHPSHRRKGIATKLYQHIERESGRQLKPAISLSDDAFEFWKRYRPEAVAGDLRHIKDQLEGRPASKNGLPGKLTGASGRGVRLVYDNHPQGPGMHSVLVGAKEINDALEAAGGERLVPDHMATRYKPKDEPKPHPTKTPEFKRWFGDSKVVDDKGQPLVVYHGTAADFDAFDKKKSGAVWSSDKEGFFFSSESATASEYADFASSQTVGAANVMPVYVSLKNPLTLEKFAEITNGIRLRQRHGDGADALTRFFDDERDLLVRYAKQEKNDGILLEKDGKRLVVAFRPEQVKSAIGNSGAFDPDHPDITKSMTAPILFVRRR